MNNLQLDLCLAIQLTGSLSKAAEHLHISASSASTRLKALENEIGFPLFTRTNGGTVTTTSGDLFLKEIMIQKNRMEATIRQCKILQDFSTDNYMIINAPLQYKSTKLSELFANFMIAHPQYKIQYSTTSLGEAEISFANHRIGAITYITDYLKSLPDAEIYALGTYEVVICVRNTDPLCRKEYITADDIRDRSIAVCIFSKRYFVQALQGFTAIGLHNIQNFSVLDNAIFEIISTDSVGLLPSFLELPSHKLATLAFKPTIKIPFGIAFHTNDDNRIKQDIVRQMLEEKTPLFVTSPEN